MRRIQNTERSGWLAYSFGGGRVARSLVGLCRQVLRVWTWSTACWSQVPEGHADMLGGEAGVTWVWDVGGALHLWGWTLQGAWERWVPTSTKECWEQRSSPRLETVRMAINRRTVKQIVILCPCHGILLRDRKGETAGMFSTVSSSQHLHVEQRKWNPKECIRLYDVQE